MKTTKISFNLLGFEYTKNETDSPPANVEKSPPEWDYVERAEGKRDPAEERSEMTATSEENAKAKIPQSKEHKTSAKKVVLTVVLAIIAIIAACKANTTLVNDMLTKLIEIL